MDFPINLDASWVYGLTELEQNIKILLKNPVGSFIQSCTVGSGVSVHASDESLLEESIRETLSQIPYIVINQITVSSPNVDVTITYNGEVIKFQYSIDQ